ncbi:MAG TPA: hypothetical protein EYG68_00160 [Leucothrix mucor]|nr:hypothetical protein [Leucothrix mucor]
MKVSLYMVGAFLVIQILASCGSGTPRHTAKPVMSELQKNIANLVENKACDNDAQCKSMAYGAKACGGPTSYLIYSIKHTNTARLTKEVKQYNQLAREDNIREGRISNCSMLMPVLPICKKKQCVASR